MSNDAGARALTLICPACGGEVTFALAEAYAGRRVGCSHCGEECWLDRDEGEEGPGPWMLVPEEYGEPDRR